MALQIESNNTDVNIMLETLKKKQRATGNQLSEAIRGILAKIKSDQSSREKEMIKFLSIISETENIGKLEDGIL
jgi:hypothetical protein